MLTENLQKLVLDNARNNISLHQNYINPQFAKVLQTIGFDQAYVKADKAYLYDANNKRYTDFLAGYGVYQVGRNHPYIKQKLKEAIDLNLANLVQMEAPILSGILARELVKRMPDEGLNRVFFSNSGTEAIEAALKFARTATGRERFIYLDHAFHGLSTGSLSINGNHEFKDGFGKLLGPNWGLNNYDLDALEHELKKKDVAAFVFEPIQGKGVYFAPDGFLQKAFELCKKYKTLTIADEVQTGLGRTGKFLACEHFGIKPDIVTIAKALSGGMVPVGATIMRAEVHSKTFSRMDRCVVHSSTFGQNNLAMVCGLAVLDVLESENLLQKAKGLGDYLKTKLLELKERSEWIKDVRGLGLMIGIEFGQPKKLSHKLKWKMVHQVDKGLFGELIVIPLMQNHGMLTQVSGHHQDIIKLIPPLVITQQDCDAFVNALEQVLLECNKMAGPIWKIGKNLIKHSVASKMKKSA